MYDDVTGTRGATPADSAPLGPLDCHAAVLRLWDYLDQELDEADMQAVDAHLAVCEKCPSHFEFERALLRAVAAARADHTDPERLRERVVAALAGEGFARR